MMSKSNIYLLFLTCTLCTVSGERAFGGISEVGKLKTDDFDYIPALDTDSCLIPKSSILEVSKVFELFIEQISPYKEAAELQIDEMRTKLFKYIDLGEKLVKYMGDKNYLKMLSIINDVADKVSQIDFKGGESTLDDIFAVKYFGVEDFSSILQVEDFPAKDLISIKKDILVKTTEFLLDGLKQTSYYDMFLDMCKDYLPKGEHDFTKPVMDNMSSQKLSTFFQIIQKFWGKMISENGYF